MTNMQASVFKSNTMFHAYLSLTVVNDKYASTVPKSHSVVNAYLSLTMVNDKNASILFMICTRLSVVNDKYAGY